MYITLDIGGTNLRVASFQNLNPESLVEVIYDKPHNDYENDLTNIKSKVYQLLGDAELQGLALGIGSALDDKNERILSSNKFTTWIGKDLKKDLEAEFKTKVVLAGDSDTAAMSQALFAKESEDFLLLIWGTGVGGCYAFKSEDKWLFKHSELGHQRFSLDSTSAEDFVGGRGMERIFGKHPSELNEDEWDRVEHNLANIIFNAQNILPVSKIVFSGGVAFKQKVHVEKVINIVNEKLVMAKKLKYDFAQYGENAGLIGALACFNN